MTSAPSPSDIATRLEILQAGLDLLDQGITVFDGELKLVAWNQTFLRLLDFPEALARVGTPFAAFIRHNAERGEYGPGDRELQVAERLAAAASFQPHTTERRRPNGRVLLLRGEPLPHKGFVTLYSDITEQRYIEGLTEHQNIQLEECVRRRTAQLENANANLTRANAENTRITAALQRSEERLRLTNDMVPILIGYVDKDEVYQYANKGYSDWYGHPEGAVIDVIGPHVYAQVRDSVRKALAGQQVTYEYQMERQGKMAHARSTLVPEITAEGETLGFFVFSHDITEQKRMPAALVQAQKMEAIGQLTGGLAHDFNNLLTVVIGNLAALQDHRPDDAELQEFVEPALQSARRGVQLIKRLLTFSRQKPLEPQAVDIAKLIGDLARLVRRSLPESVSVSTDLAGAAIHALVDPGQLESALLNFALNARDAMPDGGQLHIAARPVELLANAAAFEVPPGRYAMLEVADNGVGMDAATLARVFEPFFTTKRFGLGSGLGLAMVYGFVKQSGGRHLDSEPARAGHDGADGAAADHARARRSGGRRRGVAGTWRRAGAARRGRAQRAPRRAPAADRPRSSGDRGRGWRPGAGHDRVDPRHRHRRQRRHHARRHQRPPAGRAAVRRLPADALRADERLCRRRSGRRRPGAAGAGQTLRQAGPGACPATGETGSSMNDNDSGKLIVIVEDGPDVARIIEQVLRDFSFRTVWCRSASDLLRRLRALAPDLCIIDLGLPDMDGLEVMQRVRAQSASASSS